MTASKDTTEQSLELLRLLARVKHIPLDDRQTAHSGAPFVITENVPETSRTGSPDREPSDETSAATSSIAPPTSHRHPAKRLYLWLVALSLFGVALVAGLAAVFLYRTPNAVRELPRVERAAPSAPVVKPAVQTATQGLSELQSVQKAMADCDKEAAQNPESLYLLIIPVWPITDVARTTSPESEIYQTFFLMTSKATLAGLEDASHTIDPRPFIFSIVDPTNSERKNWNLVSGLTKLMHNGPEQFHNFRVGFDPTGRGFGHVWSKTYSRQPSVCYWINVRFRPQSYDAKR